MKYFLATLSLFCLLVPQAALAATEYVAASYGYTTGAGDAPLCWTGNVTYVSSLELCRTQMAQLKATATSQGKTLVYPDECKAVTARDYTIKPDKNVPDCATYDAQKTTAAATTKTTDTAAPTESTEDAESGFVPLTNIQNVKFAGNAADLPDFLNSIYMICIGLAAVIGVLQIMRAGVTWMTAGGSHEKVGQAKNLVRDTIIGLVLVLAPTIVFSIINPDILSLKIGNLERLKIEDSPELPEGVVKDIITGDGSAGACAVYVEHRPVKTDTSKVCSEVLKSAEWKNISGSCCIGGTSPGWMCCGRTAQQTTKEPPAAGTYRFELAQESTKMSGVFGEDGQRCLLRTKETFATKAACDEKLLQVSAGLATKESFLIENCSGVKGDTNSVEWAKLKNLPSC